MEMNEQRNLFVKKVWLVATEDVSGVGFVGREAVVDLKSGKAWADVYFTPGTASFTQEPIRKNGADAYRQNFSMSLPGEDDEAIYWVDEMANRPVLIKLDTSSGLRLLGSLTNPCRLRVGYSMIDSGMVARVEREAEEMARPLES